MDTGSGDRKHACKVACGASGLDGQLTVTHVPSPAFGDRLGPLAGCTVTAWSSSSSAWCVQSSLPEPVCHFLENVLVCVFSALRLGFGSQHITIAGTSSCHRSTVPPPLFEVPPPRPTHGSAMAAYREPSEVNIQACADISETKKLQ